MRVEQEAARRGNAAVVISTVLSLLVVVAAVGVVAWLVLRTPSTAVDSAERLDPVGTALPAPTEPPALPTIVPTTEPENEAEPEPTALGFTGEAPAVSGLPTVAAPEESAGPTPTPRVIAQPTEPPPPAPTALPAAPTLPPSVPVTQVPVVALEPVEAAPPPTRAPAPTQATSAPTPVPDEDDDPFNIFDDDPRSRVAGVENEALARVREMQEERDAGRSIVVPTFAPGSERRRDDSSDAQDLELPDIAVPTPNIPGREPNDEPAIVESRDDRRDNAMPDVDAMIDEITARATDPDRNPNARDAGRRITDRDDEDDEDEDNDESSDRRKRRRSAREIIDERLGRDSDSRAIVPGVARPGDGQDNQPCTDPTAEGFPFNC